MKLGLPRRDQWLLHLALVFGLLACVARLHEERQGTPPQCWWQERGPVVPHDTFPADCALCHEGDDWQTIRQDFAFDHELETGVPLNGAHAAAECLRCHNDRGPVRLFAQRGCAGCHEDVHRGQLGHDCSACHDEADWQVDETMALHDRTRLPLVGAHAAVQCWVCHPGAQVGSFRNVDPECASCHLDEYNATTDPDHAASGFSTSCEDCHGFVAFDAGTSFSHAGIVDGCAECHLSDYQGTTDPDHEAGNFPTTCEDCHNTILWHSADFSHEGIVDGCYDCHMGDYQASRDPDHQAAGYPISCELCHGTLMWPGADFDHAGVGSGCQQCHLLEYRATTDPDHEALGFPTTCQSCHGTNMWEGAVFNHDGITDGCVDCHLGEYRATTDPDHEALGFPTACENCHVTTMWLGAQFDHTGITNDCVRCHLADYQATTSPDHEALGYPTACESCHDTNMWEGALFDHAGITNNCVSCHLSDYQATSDPKHSAAGFPQTCESCHGSFSTWQGGRYDAHDFPIYSGRHSGLACSQCHLTNTNYDVFSCTHCHEHRQSAMDDRHEGRDGYVWESSACYRCHPDGRD
jgi:hypothetical protein